MMSSSVSLTWNSCSIATMRFKWNRLSQLAQLSLVHRATGPDPRGIRSTKIASRWSVTSATAPLPRRGTRSLERRPDPQVGLEDERLARGDSLPTAD